MTRQINFLSERRKNQSKRQLQDRKILTISGIGFGLVVISAFLLFVFQLYLKFQYRQVQLAAERSRDDIVANEDVEKSFVLFLAKTKSLAALATNRQQKQLVIADFNRLFSPYGLATEISFRQAVQLIRFRVKVENIFKYRQLVASLKQVGITQKYPKLRTSDLTRGETGSYELDVIVDQSTTKTVPSPTP